MGMISFCIINRFQPICKKSPKTAKKLIFPSNWPKTACIRHNCGIFQYFLIKGRKYIDVRRQFCDMKSFYVAFPPFSLILTPWSWNMPKITQNLVQKFGVTQDSQFDVFPTQINKKIYLGIKIAQICTRRRTTTWV